jgi:hypothetical protein
MSEDTISWQAYHGRVSERHAYLYLRKATQGYNFQKEELINFDIIQSEMANLSRAAVYFSSRGKPELARHLEKVIEGMIEYGLAELSYLDQNADELAKEVLRLKEESHQARKRAFQEIYGTEERKSMTSCTLTSLPRALRELASRIPTSPRRRTN